MKRYIEKLKSTLTNMNGITEETVMYALYSHHVENLGPDRGEIARGFAELDRLLDELTRKEYDRI